MVKIREMPYSEKYASILDYTKLLETFVLFLIKKHLGVEGVTALQEIWQKKLQPVLEDASIRGRYEVAYRNWVMKRASALDFIRYHLGEDGVKEFIREDVKVLKRKSSSPASFLLKIVRKFSHKFVFRAIAKRMAYQLQICIPYTITELTRRRLVITLPHCKVLDFQGGEDACVISCQIIYSTWLNEQFKMKMRSEREGKSCKITITPL